MIRVGMMLSTLETAPLVGISQVLRGKRALILAPHPDDESLGCGGLIASSCAAGIAPVVVVLTDGAASHPASVEFPPSRLRVIREQEAVRAVEALGLEAERIKFLRYADTQLALSGAKPVERIVSIGVEFGCGVVLGPWHGDPHCDHETGAFIAAEVARRTGWDLLSYPVWGWLRERDDMVDEPRQGGFRMDISMFLTAKQNAIAAHASQYGGMIKDSPEGFALPSALLAIFARPFEVFIR